MIFTESDFCYVFPTSLIVDLQDIIISKSYDNAKWLNNFLRLET